MSATPAGPPRPGAAPVVPGQPAPGSPAPPVVPPGPPEPPESESSELEPNTTEVEENGAVPAEVLDNIREQRAEVAAVVGKTKILEVPGYKGCLAIEYKYIGSEITENIARKVRRETRSANGQGSTLLASIDTLRAACRRVLVRADTHSKWKSPGGDRMPIVRLDSNLARLLKFDPADFDPDNSGRGTVLGVFGSEHKINQANLLVSQWLSDTTREIDEDFLG